MINPDRTRAELLAAIEAADTALLPLTDITDPLVATDDVHVRVCGRTKDDLFPRLELALSERYATVPRRQLLRDLLIPVRKALGNANKHGNQQDPAKAVAVEIVLTRKGGIIAITDEGPGFNVARVFEGFQAHTRYFVNQGSGFRNFDRAESTVSYENGGRTILLCYRPGDRSPHPEHGSPRDPRLGSTPKILDSKWMRGCLSDELPAFRDGSARLESCRVYAEQGHECKLRYVLRIAGVQGAVETRVLTGRLHSSAGAAAADFTASSSLYDSAILMRYRVPRPVARLRAEPRLVLFEFQPSMNLFDYLEFRDSLRSVHHASERAGASLAALHRSGAALPTAECGVVGEALQTRIARAETRLRSLSGLDFVALFRDSVRELAQRPGARLEQVMDPIHGSFGWDSVHYGVDGCFYLYRFENCRRSDPGLDLGGFAADLLCFTLAHYNAEAYRVCSDKLLKHYNVEAEHRMDEVDLRCYTVLALCDRIERPDRRTPFSEDDLVTALKVAFRGGPD